MKLSHLCLTLLAVTGPLAAAWSKEDREIFRIRDEIAAHEADPAATFYDMIGVLPSASLDDINKAYRLKTRALHPDKVKQRLRAERVKGEGRANKARAPTPSELKAAVKQASERQARLSLIANILRGPGRDRYDHYLANGFPLWKGTDYYYDRYRPGLGTAVVGVFLLAGGAVHYLVLYMGWKRQREFVERYIKFARDTAWGGGIPGIDSLPVDAPAQQAADPDAEEAEDAPPQPQNRKQRRMMEKGSRREEARAAGGRRAQKTQKTQKAQDAPPAPAGSRKRVIAENGKVLVVDSLGDVFLEEHDDDGNVMEFLLDPNELAEPSFTDTAVVRAPVWLFRKTVGRVLRLGEASAGEVTAAAVDEDEEEDSDLPQNTPSTDSAGEDFEMLDKSTESLPKATRTTGAQQGGGPSKRKGRKR